MQKRNEIESPIQALKNFRFTRNFWRRALIALLGVVIMGITIGLMQAVNAGTDPYSLMCYGIARITGIMYGTVSFALNGIAFIVLVFINWKLFGLGTILNMVVVGYTADFTRWILTKCGFSLDKTGNVAVVIITILSLLFFMVGVALYIDAGLGTSPYDAIPNLFHQLINKNRKKEFPYKFVRIPFDLFFTVLAFILCDWSAGVGTTLIRNSVTIIMAFFLGPIIDRVANFLKKVVKL